MQNLSEIVDLITLAPSNPYVNDYSYACFRLGWVQYDVRSSPQGFYPKKIKSAVEARND